MKVLLVNAPFSFDDTHIQGAKAGARWAHRSPKGFIPFPFFLAYAAAVLKKTGHETGVIDAVAEGLGRKEFIDRVKKYTPELVFLECSTPSIETDLKFLEEIKKNTNVITVLGGSHATALAESLLRGNSFIDFILKNEYDFTAAKLASTIEKGLSPEEVEGLCRRENNEITISKETPFVENLDELPYPARELFPMECYNEGLCDKPNTTIMSSRGCPYGCIFCLWPQSFYGTKKYRVRTPSLVVDEIEMLLKKYNPKELYFDDDTFTVNKERVIEIANGIKRRGLKFKWDCLGHVGNMDRELLTAMKEAGCCRIRYGVETGSDKILKNINKPITRRQIKDVFELTKDAGIARHATVTFGLPGDTKKTLNETIKFVLELDPETVQFSIAAPFPGTKFFKLAEEKGWFRTKDFSRFDGHSYSVLDLDEVKAWDIENAYREANGAWAVHRRRRGDNPAGRNIKEFLKHPFRAIKFLIYYLKYN